MERDVCQAVGGEGKETQKADKKHCLGTFKQTQRCVLYTETGRLIFSRTSEQLNMKHSVCYCIL